MALTDDVTAVETAVTAVQAAVETVKADVEAQTASVGDDLLADVVAFLEAKGYTVTAPSAEPVA